MAALRQRHAAKACPIAPVRIVQTGVLGAGHGEVNVVAVVLRRPASYIPAQARVSMKAHARFVAGLGGVSLTRQETQGGMDLVADAVRRVADQPLLLLIVLLRIGDHELAVGVADGEDAGAVLLAVDLDEQGGVAIAVLGAQVG